jgi:hypothetical protein
MPLTAPVATLRPSRHRHPVLNRIVLAVLRSPLHPLLDPGICELVRAAAAYRRRPALSLEATERLLLIEPRGG